MTSFHVLYIKLLVGARDTPRSEVREENVENGRPLAGIRILEIAAYISGPYCAAILESLGAEIVKIEPLNGDPWRRGEGVSNPFFAQYNAGKRSVGLDLKSPAAVDAVKAMLPKFDVLIENMRPGKIDSLGLSREVCQAINPSLIYTSISGFGRGGPWANRPAYDSIGQSLGGLFTVMNDPEDVRLTGTCLADMVTSISSALGIVAGLVSRERSGDKKGLKIETSVLEAVSMLTADAMTQALAYDVDPVRETRHPQGQGFCLKTASGEYIIVHLSSSDRFWRSLLRSIEREDLLNESRFQNYASRAEPENYRAVAEVMKEEFLKQPFAEWERRLTEADVPFAPAVTMRQMAHHPQMKWLDILQPTQLGFPLIRVPWSFDGTRPDRRVTVPNIGEHTRNVLSEALSAQQIDDLAASGAIAPGEQDIGPGQ